MQLIYRGHSYLYTATGAKPIRQPCAINWRYRLPGTAQIEIQPANPLYSLSLCASACD